MGWVYRGKEADWYLHLATHPEAWTRSRYARSKSSIPSSFDIPSDFVTRDEVIKLLEVLLEYKTNINSIETVRRVPYRYELRQIDDRPIHIFKSRYY